MKTIWLIFLFTLITCISYSQDERDPNINLYSGILSNLYVNHHPSAKGESMGRGLVANSEGNFGAYYNPALTSLTNGLKINFSSTRGNKYNSRLNYYEASYTNEKWGSFGIGAYYINKNPPSEYGYNRIGKGTYYDAAYTINYSKEVVKDFYAGVNLGIFHYSRYVESMIGFDDVYYDDGAKLDLGLLKKFEIETKFNTHIFQIELLYTMLVIRKYHIPEGSITTGCRCRQASDLEEVISSK